MNEKHVGAATPTGRRCALHPIYFHRYPRGNIGSELASLFIQPVAIHRVILD